MLHLKTELLEALTVEMPVDVSTRELIALKQSVEENVQMLNGTINSVVDEIYDYLEKAECVARLTQDRHRNTLIMAAAVQNLTTQYRRIVNDINQRSISGCYVVFSARKFAKFSYPSVNVDKNPRFIRRQWIK